MFVHIKSFSNRYRRPLGNEIVSYELVSNQKDRTRAEHVAFISDSFTIPGERGAVAFALPGLFLLFVAAAVFVGQLPLASDYIWLPVLSRFCFTSAISRPPQKGRWRTNENTLHVFSLIGGWPAAFVAQKLLRHKSRKESFRILFWATVVLNCVGLSWAFFAMWR